MVHIGNDWDTYLQDVFLSEPYQRLRLFLKQEYGTHVIYPPMDYIFSALKKTSYEQTKVVILGQDPYHEPNQANGLAFSVQEGVPLPPSLQNIYKELASDVQVPPSKSGDLSKWAENGVLLLNTTLTVRQGAANSHYGKGWEFVTDEIIKRLSMREKPMVFILWGRNARNKKNLIDTQKHFIIESAHPSPLSAYNGFFGSKPFSKANAFLIQHNISPIDWNLAN